MDMDMGMGMGMERERANMAAVKNEAEYNVLTKRIVLEERLQKRSKIKD